MTVTVSLTLIGALLAASCLLNLTFQKATALGEELAWVLGVLGGAAPIAFANGRLSL